MSDFGCPTFPIRKNTLYASWWRSWIVMRGRERERERERFLGGGGGMDGWRKLEKGINVLVCSWLLSGSSSSCKQGSKSVSGRISRSEDEASENNDYSLPPKLSFMAISNWHFSWMTESGPSLPRRKYIKAFIWQFTSKKVFIKKGCSLTCTTYNLLSPPPPLPPLLPCIYLHVSADGYSLVGLFISQLSVHHSCVLLSLSSD